MTKHPATVDAYIAGCPAEHRPKLREMRALIKAAAPEAEERISYGMPYYHYHGRLAYFRLWPRHIGLYIPTPVVQDFAKELTGYQTAKATIRFPLDRKLPAALIRRLVKARMRINTGDVK